MDSNLGAGQSKTNGAVGKEVGSEDLNRPVTGVEGIDLYDVR